MSHGNTQNIIAKNIAELRRKNGLTQAELAEKLGYSDKSISKWERAEGLPDVLCLKAIADMFSVTVDYFFREEHGEGEFSHETMQSGENRTDENRGKYVTNHRAITWLSVVAVWLLATVIFVVGLVSDKMILEPFAVAFFVTSILLVVFNSLWGKRELHFYTVSSVVWSTLFLISFLLRKYNLWLLMVIGVPATVVVALACRVKVKKIDRDSSESDGT